LKGGASVPSFSFAPSLLQVALLLYGAVTENIAAAS
jgi:hypothetical protein